MKKILIILTLASALYAEAKIYIGTGVGVLHEKFSSGSDKAKTYNHAKVKIGYGDIDAYAVEFSFDYTEKNHATNSYNSNDSYGVNIELIKAFDFKTFTNPYLKAGFGFGSYKEKTSDKDSGSKNYGNFILGTGLLIPFSQHYDLQLGYEYKTFSYENSEEESIKSNAHIGYLGINIRF